ncbi:efflux RND transporter permease subunit [Salinisphaera sp. P385]|uniref:Efflux RND transporter permease subunit n=1 Tax=Spectribacter acetivorans TaxID=3075603 RepID=A0ABU3BBU1_9GAMM|nr:efflux RND transporter permease subunit [Salinisphaera sp. P385]MDT0619930.1 efflux RND transporter permease subunit [Salinisphaera sp. P385]
MSMTQRILRIVEPVIFGARWITLAVLIAITAFLGWQASQLQPNAGWLKMVPQEHPYMETFLEYYDEFGGANTVLVALKNKDGDIYQPEFMEDLRKLTDEVFFIPGVQRERVTSIFTPNILYVEVQPTGLSGSTVVPADYAPTPEMMDKLRSNVSKANVIGRLVSNDQSAAMVVAELLERDPVTNEKIDYNEVGDKLEAIRTKFEDENTTVHIIGFAKVVDDMTDAATEVVGFFALTLILTGILLWLYTGSFMLGMLPLVCSIAAVIWEMGLLNLAGFGLDPFAILVPFLVLAVSVSHGVQYVNAWASEIADAGHTAYRASLNTFRRLAIPGTIALITDVAGFLTIYLIDIDVIREMSLNAAFGIAAIIITNKALMPVLLTVANVRDREAFQRKHARREALGDRLWRFIAATFTKRPAAVVTLLVCALILGWSVWKYDDLTVGSAQEGVPELRPDSRFNQDARLIAENFSLGVDQFNVIAETVPDACIKYDLMAELDRFAWHMKNETGVRETMTLLDLSKLAYAGLSEGRLNAQVVPRNRYALAQATALVPTTSGMLNDDCSALNVFLFTTDHKAATIKEIVAAVKAYKAEENSTPDIEFKLASGNVGVMAATNEVVEAKEVEIVLWVYAVVLTFLWLSFRTFSGVICVALPLSLVSISAYGVMATLGIGMKVATLPVIALAVGIGVDYGIYIYATLAEGLRRGMSLEEAYYRTLQKTGKAVVFTGVALGLGVATWLFSKLQFQADMGLMLVYMFTANMFGAILVLPALAHFFAGEETRHQGQDITSGASDEPDERKPS